MAATKTQTAPSLDRALTILELVAQSRVGLTLPELVERSRIPRSSVHYLLVTLERRGYLGRNQRTSRYLFGTQVLSLANDALSRLSLRYQAAPYLQALMQNTHLTVHMAVLERDEAVLVARHKPPSAPDIATWIGKRMNVHCTSLGKALIAWCPENHIDRLIREHGLPRHNENTLCTPRRLKEDLAKVERLGYAVDDEEDELGLRCIAVLVFDPGGESIASISVAGTTLSIQLGEILSLVSELKRTAMLISAAHPDVCKEIRKFPQAGTA